MNDSESDKEKVIGDLGNLGSLSEEKPKTESKFQSGAERVLEEADSNQLLAVVIRVDKEGYIPDGIKPTVKVSPLMFTARIRIKELELLEKDSHVIAVQLSENLQNR